MDAADRL